MPTYQYACKECGHDFEQVQSFSDASLTECPQCEGRLRKVFNAVGVVFKGSGFYRNDSRPASSTSDAPSGKDAGSKDSGSTDAGSGSGSGDSATKESSSSTSGSSGAKETSGSSSGSGSSKTGSASTTSSTSSSS